MQKRRRHFIAPTTRCEYPRCVVAVEADSQTVSGVEGQHYCDTSLTGWNASIATLKQGEVIFTWEECGSNVDEWYAFLVKLSRHYRNVLIVSWNTWRNSILLGFWTGLENGRISLCWDGPRRSAEVDTAKGYSRSKYWVLENPPTILPFTLTYTEGSFKWIDLRNFGLSKLTGTDAEPISSRQVLGIYTDIIRFLKENDLGSVRATVGSQSLSSWKYRFLKHSIHVSTNEATNILGQAALFGGRNECYRLGAIDGTISQFDFNSLYPSIYSREALPIRLRGIRQSPSDGYIAAAIKGKNCIARVLVSTDVPCVPYRRKGNLIFPVGRFRTVVCWPELELALNECKSVRITEIATYDCEPVLADFGRNLYACRVTERTNGNKALSAYIKALLVSLPGKFGQKCKRWEISKDQRCESPWSVFNRPVVGKKTGRCRSIAWQVEEEVDNGLAYDAVPEIAAWVNSWGRRLLWEEMKRVGRERIVYVDTDSIWIRRGLSTSNASNLPAIGDELGSMRLVGTYNSVKFHGLKHYEADGVSTPRVNRENGGVNISIQGTRSNFSGIMAACQRGHGITSWDKCEPVLTCKEYTAGIVNPDLSVSPIQLEGW